MEERQEAKISKYSSGVNILMRLDELWKKSHSYRLSSQYKRWNTILDSIWSELARDLGEKNYNNTKTKFEEFENKLSNSGKIIDNPELEIGFDDIKSTDINNRSKQYNLLMEKQLFLARLENELGKGTTYADEDDDDFD